MQAQPQRWNFLITDERALLSVSLWAGVLLIDGIVWSRRLSGAMTIPLSCPLVWGSSLVFTAATIGALIAWKMAGIVSHRRMSWWPELLTLAVSLLWGIAVGLQTTPFIWGGLAALAGMLIVTVGLAPLWFPMREAVLAAGELASDRVGGVTISAVDAVQPTSANSRPTHCQRRIHVDGAEAIEGEVTVEFLPGQKETTIHLSFCPPFSMLPEIQAEASLGGDLEIRVEAAHPFGARLSVRRGSSIEAAESHEISYFASPSLSGEAAA